MISLSLACALLVSLVDGSVRLARAALPASSADRVNWWKRHWKHRRNIRRDRWRRRDQRYMRRHNARRPNRRAVQRRHIRPVDQGRE